MERWQQKRSPHYCWQQSHRIQGIKNLSIAEQSMERLKDIAITKTVMQTAGKEREASASPQIANIGNPLFGGKSKSWLRLG